MASEKKPKNVRGSKQRARKGKTTRAETTEGHPKDPLRDDPSWPGELDHGAREELLTWLPPVGDEGDGATNPVSVEHLIKAVDALRVLVAPRVEKENAALEPVLQDLTRRFFARAQLVCSLVSRIPLLPPPGRPFDALGLEQDFEASRLLLESWLRVTRRQAELPLKEIRDAFETLDSANAYLDVFVAVWAASQRHPGWIRRGFWAWPILARAAVGYFEEKIDHFPTCRYIHTMIPPALHAAEACYDALREGDIRRILETHEFQKLGLPPLDRVCEPIYAEFNAALETSPIRGSASQEDEKRILRILADARREPGITTKCLNAWRSWWMEFLEGVTAHVGPQTLSLGEPDVSVGWDHANARALSSSPRQKGTGQSGEGVVALSSTTSSVGDLSHSSDFTSVNWFGTKYQFTKVQAECVRILWREWERGEHSLSEGTIGDELDSAKDRFRLSEVFRVKGREFHSAWETMIVCVGKGVFALRKPENP